MELVTLEEVKEFLRLPLDYTVEDSYITLLTDGVENQIRQYCNRQFVLDEYTEKIYVDSEKIFVREIPLLDIVSIKDDKGNELYYDSFFKHGLIVLSKSFKGYVEVTYTGGELPNNVKLAILRLVEYYYNKAEGIESQNFEGTNVKYDIPNGVLSLLESERMYMV